MSLPTLGAGPSALPSGFTGPLDGISNIAAAYSVRRLLSSYTSNLIRIRRASDNGEQDFGYDSNGDLDTASIATFLTATTGYIVTWYDQTDTSDATQATASLQFRYIASAVNSKPALESGFTNDDHRLAYTGTFPEDLHLVELVQTINTATLQLWGAPSGTNTPSIRLNSLSDKPLAYLATGHYQYWTADTTYRNGSPHVHSFYAAGPDAGDLTNLELREDGTARTKDTNLSGTPGTVSTTYINGTIVTAGGYEYIPEFVVHSGQLSAADHNQIGNSMGTYYGITWNTVT